MSVLYVVVQVDATWAGAYMAGRAVQLQATAAFALLSLADVDPGHPKGPVQAEIAHLTAVCQSAVGVCQSLL